MPLTALDPNTALLVIDLQKGIVPSAIEPPIHQVIEHRRR